MTIKQAIERLKFMIEQCTCCEEVLLDNYSDDAREELHDVEAELETLRMAVRALEEKSLAEEAAELAQAALKERRALEDDNPTPVSYTDAHANLLEEVADVFVGLGELLSLADWETVAHTRAEKENRWMQRLEERESK